YWNGISICRVLRANPQTQLVPVVLIAGQDSDEDLMEAAAAGADDFLEEPFRSAEVLSRVRSLLRLKRYTDEMERAEQVLFNLALRVEARDACTSGHCERLSRYSVAVADRLGLGAEQRLALRHASLLHDVGMIGVPEAILLKPAPLTPEERKVVETHPIAGEQICAPLRSMREVLPIIRHHHERFDGSGYPDGLAGTRIPITVRIFSVADVFDALTSDRPFRKALSMSQAITVMQEEVRLGWLDPAVVEVFESLITDPVQ